MNTRLFHKVITLALAVAAMAGVTSCNEKKFHIDGTITGAADSTLYFENMGLDGAVKIDSAKLSEDGTFAFEGTAPTAPEFYRLRIAGQFINIAVDSTETINIKAQYPQMATQYEVSGSEDCQRIKELSLMQSSLQAQVNAIARNPELGAQAAADSVSRIVEAYKTRVKTEYIFKAPMKASSYFALFQTIYAGGQPVLLFNPRTSEQDIKVFGAVATSWDTFYPNEKRGENLHNIAIEGMKDVRYLRSQQQAEEIEASKVNTSGILDFTLTDNTGAARSLSSLKGNVVLLDFHLFADQNSMKRIMSLRELYNKYHAQGFQIYQVAIDGDEHFWKTQTAALPWISTRVDDNTSSVLQMYNVQQVPTFFLLNRSCNVVKRDAQIKDIDAEIKALL
ncbi:TlpA disulfide reductase family protein [Prevotella sp. 885]|uniref:TlpA disulfide reductase family protein n=1 Tax=Prevotella sp. 885 TaxID=2022527 RepID=UPI000BA1760C|nr:TlpA disulfide reductase family protein [Prevotella sp. 885]OZT05215.1 peroxiredoxin [Prevotella sp. 885]